MNMIQRLINMNAVETAFFIAGSILVVSYFCNLIIYANRACKEKTDSKGIKKLKFQLYNPIWNKYCMR